MFDKLVALILAGTLSASVAAASSLVLDRTRDLARILYDPLTIERLVLGLEPLPCWVTDL